MKKRKRCKMSNFYSKQELNELGFKSVGENVLVSKKASIYGASNISIGDNVRVDDFCILSGKIDLGDYIHISAYTSLFGGDAGITVGDYCAISSRVAVYAVTDDYFGEGMVNPMVPDKYKKVTEDPVNIGRNCIIGSGSTVLPGVTLEEGVSVGAMSLINKDLEGWTVYAGIPAKKLKDRSKEMLKKMEEFEKDNDK